MADTFLYGKNLTFKQSYLLITIYKKILFKAELYFNLDLSPSPWFITNYQPRCLAYLKFTIANFTAKAAKSVIY